MQEYDTTKPDLGSVRGGEPRCNLAEHFIIASIRIVKARCIYEVDCGGRAQLAGVYINGGCTWRGISD